MWLQWPGRPIVSPYFELCSVWCLARGVPVPLFQGARWAANGCLITVPFLPISSLTWPYDLGFWWPGNKRAADCLAPQELRLCVWRMLAAGGIESYTDTHQLTESRMITWQNDALLMCHLLLLTLLKYLYILYLPSASSWTFYWLKSPFSNTGYISPFTWPWLPSSTIGVPHFFCSKKCPFLSTILLAINN